MKVRPKPGSGLPVYCVLLTWETWLRRKSVMNKGSIKTLQTVAAGPLWLLETGGEGVCVKLFRAG